MPHSRLFRDESSPESLRICVSNKLFGQGVVQDLESSAFAIK